MIRAIASQPYRTGQSGYEPLDYQEIAYTDEESGTLKATQQIGSNVIVLVKRCYGEYVFKRLSRVEIIGPFSNRIMSGRSRNA